MGDVTEQRLEMKSHPSAVAVVLLFFLPQRLGKEEK
jgi:hypothetical protein